MKTRIIAFHFFIILFLLSSCTLQRKTQPETEDAFTFAFLTDIHLQPERNAEAGFQQAIDSVNKLSPRQRGTGVIRGTQPEVGPSGASPCL